MNEINRSDGRESDLAVVDGDIEHRVDAHVGNGRRRGPFGRTLTSEKVKLQGDAVLPRLRLQAHVLRLHRMREHVHLAQAVQQRSVEQFRIAYTQSYFNTFFID